MKKISVFICCIFFAYASFAQNIVSTNNVELPLRRIALFSSGVGYFEHSGSVSGNVNLNLTFEVEAINDVLKSLVVNNPGRGATPIVRYPSEDTLERTLQSLGIDLSRNPSVAEIFASQRGSEIEVFAPNIISGRILGVERRPIAGGNAFGMIPEAAFLSLHTNAGIRVIALSEIVSFRFKNPALTEDIQRALDLIAANRTERNRSLQIHLPGTGSRSVLLSYVIAAPVWKVSYRLDLGQQRPLFQGWAIVDNNSDTDWNNVELSLISGRPVSFIQELYPPYYHSRPTLPLAIVGSARSRIFAGGFDRRERALSENNFVTEDMAMGEVLASQPMTAARRLDRAGNVPAPNVGNVQAATAGTTMGDHFAFTITNPVTLNRRQSTMIPMVSNTIEAVKTLVLPGNMALTGNIHPDLAAELTNTTGMKLPAGPITVFDGGSYAGDALIEFLGINDKRFIKYGEDLSVIATAAHSPATRLVSAVTITGGVMTINRRQIHERIYTIRNTASGETKRLIIEHPITGNSTLIEPKRYLEKTDSLYRFSTTLPSNRELTFRVQEETPLSERIVLGQLRLESLVSYSTNQEIPSNVRKALTRAVELRQKADAARQTHSELEARRTRLVSEQDRVRQNLTAVGASSSQGAEYMRRMTALDNDIDRLNREIEQAAGLVRSTQKALDDYIAGLRL